MSHDARLVRTHHAAAWASRDSVTVLGRGGRAVRLDGPSGDLCLAALEHLSRPSTAAALAAHLEQLAGAPLPDPSVVEQLLGALRGVGAVASAGEGSRPNHLVERRVVLALSGAVAVAHAPALVLLCQREGWRVRLAATRNALRFVSRAALEAMAHAPVHASHWEGRGGVRVPHVELAEWAELVLVAPASATTVSRIARGDCSDVVSALAVTARCPVVVAPSMNAAMYASEPVQRNLRQLRDDGLHVVLPDLGVEVAHAPEARAPMLGPCPPSELLVSVARAVLAEADRARPTLPPDAAGWSRLYATTAREALPWTLDAPEPELAAALAALAGDGVRAVDLGAGDGTVALALAAMGCEVTAIDHAAAALERARRRPGADGVTWREADVTALDGAWELLVDRGCLHCLPRALHARWCEAVRRSAAPGATLVALVHDASEAAGTHGYDEPGLRALLADVCHSTRVVPAVMRGPGVARRAWLAVGRVRPAATT